MIRAEDLLHPTPAGLYCPPGDFYVDPVRPVDRAVITHGHSDHARAGHGAVLATRPDAGDHGRALWRRFHGPGAVGRIWPGDGDKRRRFETGAGGPCAGLGPGRGALQGADHGRIRRLQTPPRPDLRAVRADPVPRLHFRGDLRPARVQPSAGRRGGGAAGAFAGSVPGTGASGRRLCVGQGATDHSPAA